MVSVTRWQMDMNFVMKYDSVEHIIILRNPADVLDFSESKVHDTLGIHADSYGSKSGTLEYI
jgi:hypothetical protein